MLLDAPVPDPGPAGPYGTMPWLRATVSRFANGETHTRRRALVEALLADLDVPALREAARECAHRAAAPPRSVPVDAGGRVPARLAGATAERAAGMPTPAAATRIERQLHRALHDKPCSRRAGAAAEPTPARHAEPVASAVDAPYIPVAVLAGALGVASDDVADAVAATRVVAAAYHPHTDAPGADAALVTLIDLLPSDVPEVVAARIQILVQACEATAALVRGTTVPVPVTRRIGSNGELVLVDLTDQPFGAGSRRCPGEAHARALVEGVTGR